MAQNMAPWGGGARLRVDGPAIWASTVYETRYSRIVSGTLHVEGTTREDAIDLLYVMRRADGAAGVHARDALDGSHKHTLLRMRTATSYAAADGHWRGWDRSAWTHTPPTSYGSWHSVCRLCHAIDGEQCDADCPASRRVDDSHT